MNIESAKGFRAGRLGRGKYFLVIFGSMFLFVGAGLLVDGLIRGTFEGSPTAIMWVPIIGWWIFAFYCSVLRLRDLGMSAWWLLAIFVPILNIYLLAKLFLFAEPERAQS